jgi:hypothetical protein
MGVTPRFEPATAAEALREMARAVRELRPDRHDPEKFFLDRSEVAYRLDALADRLAGLR